MFAMLIAPFLCMVASHLCDCSGPRSLHACSHDMPELQVFSFWIIDSFLKGVDWKACVAFGAYACIVEAGG